MWLSKRLLHLRATTDSLLLFFTHFGSVCCKSLYVIAVLIRLALMAVSTFWCCGLGQLESLLTLCTRPRCRAGGFLSHQRHHRFLLLDIRIDLFWLSRQMVPPWIQNSHALALASSKRTPLDLVNIYFSLFVKRIPPRDSRLLLKLRML